MYGPTAQAAVPVDKTEQNRRREMREGFICPLCARSRAKSSLTNDCSNRRKEVHSNVHRHPIPPKSRKNRFAASASLSFHHPVPPKPMKALFRLCLAFALTSLVAKAAPTNANRLTYLAELDPFYVDGNFPKLTTPQWIGEPNI